MHPKERRLATTRRDFLLRSGGAAVSLSSISSILAACGSTTPADSGSAGGGWPTGAGGIPLARPNHPVTLERWEAPIASGMQPETGGTFTVFNYPEYIDPAVLKDFGKKYGVTVKVTPFDDINTGVTKLASGTVQPDVTEMTPDQAHRAVAGKLMKPLNLDYIPNLKNVWPALTTRSTTSDPATACPTRSTHRHRVAHRPRHGGHRRHGAARGTSSGRPRRTRARPPCSPRCARRSRWRCCARATRTSTPRIRS